MATWVIGDIHGCAEELERLLGDLSLGPTDTVVCVGDLFHRGPDAFGVARLLAGVDARFVLGNHERTVLQRAGLAPERADGSDRPPLRTHFPPLQLEDLLGDGGRPLVAPADRLGELLVFLQGHAGYVLLDTDLPAAGPTKDGGAWLVTHAGVPKDVDPRAARPEDLVYPARTRGRRGPFWYERYRGPALVLFGHVPFEEPRECQHKGRLVALGLDTGCVYGGRLTAYSPELHEFTSVPAAQKYAHI